MGKNFVFCMKILKELLFIEKTFIAELVETVNVSREINP